MKRRTLSIITIALTAAAIATAFVIIHKPIPKPEPIEGPRVYLNEKLTNEMSEIDECEGIDKKVRAFMRQWQIKGASLAVMRNDSLVYAKGYGWADAADSVEMAPSHILRMAPQIMQMPSGEPPKKRSISLFIGSRS